MKGILKIYHPEETLKYHLQSTYCKAVYLNSENFLEVEIITDDSLDHVDEDSLQNRFPQLALKISDFPILTAELSGKTFRVSDTEEEIYTEVELYDDEDAFLYDNELTFSVDEDRELQLLWQGKISDFLSGTHETLSFRLKCDFKQEEIQVED